MNVQYADFTSVTFSEVPDYAGNIDNDFVVSVIDSFNPDQYSISLFNKILTIGLSEISDFLTFNCSFLKAPAAWLNSLEKLIKLNVEHFNTSQLKHRHTKLISEIGLKRHSLQITKKVNRKKLNGFSDEKEYSFDAVKNLLTTLGSHEEKIACLRDQIFDYRQNPPEFICQTQPPFDRQCELEIERIETQETLKQKTHIKKNATGQGQKLPFNGDLKVLCDVYFKLMQKKSTNGKSILPWTITQATEHICNSFCEPDGTPLNPSTVRTYLSPSKPESRPKQQNEVNI